MKQEHKFENIVAETLFIPLYMRAKESRRKHPDAEFIFIVEGVLMYFYEKQVKDFLHHVASRFGGGELWFDVCGTMMSRHGGSLLGYEIKCRPGA